MDAYYECCFGKDHPDKICVSKQNYAIIVERMDLMSRDQYHQDKPIAGLKFLDAAVVPSEYVPEDTIVMINSNHPTDPRLNRIVKL